jgi:hypothetical protein
MRHVKLFEADPSNTRFLAELIDAAYVDVKHRLDVEPQPKK